MGWKIQLDRPDSPCHDDEAYSTGICIRNKFIEETNSPELSKHCKNPCIPPHLVIISQKQLFISRCSHSHYYFEEQCPYTEVTNLGNYLDSGLFSE